MIKSILSNIWKSSTYTLLCAFCFFGLLTTILIPPFQVPDEQAHWIAAYSRSSWNTGEPPQGNQCSLANALPSAFEQSRIIFQPQQKISGRQFKAVGKVVATCSDYQLNYGTVSTYPGVVAARTVTTGEQDFPYKAFQVFFLGRLFQGALLVLLAWRFLAVSFQSGRLIPGSLVMTAVMLSPIFVQQSFAISADTVTFALPLSLLFFMFHTPRARWFDWGVLLLLAITVGATKPPLFAAVPVFLYAGLARARIELGEKRWITSLTWSPAVRVHICVLLAFVAAIVIVSQQPVTASSQPGGGGNNVQSQIQYIASNPSVAIQMLIDSTWSKFTGWEPFIGTLGWLDAQMSGWTQKKYLQLLFLAFLGDLLFGVFGVIASPNRGSIVRALRWKIPVNVGIIVCLFGIGLCTSLILYLTWTPVGAGYVHGLQARYFLPMLLPFSLLVGDLFFAESGDSREAQGAAAFGRTVGVVVYGTMALLLFFPLYLDLILRWW